MRAIRNVLGLYRVKKVLRLYRVKDVDALPRRFDSSFGAGCCDGGTMPRRAAFPPLDSRGRIAPGAYKVRSAWLKRCCQLPITIHATAIAAASAKITSKIARVSR